MLYAAYIRAASLAKSSRIADAIAAQLAKLLPQRTRSATSNAFNRSVRLLDAVTLERDAHPA
jgi:hypothetical protein